MYDINRSQMSARREWYMTRAEPGDDAPPPPSESSGELHGWYMTRPVTETIRFEYYDDPHVEVLLTMDDMTILRATIRDLDTDEPAQTLGEESHEMFMDMIVESQRTFLIEKLDVPVAVVDRIYREAFPSSTRYRDETGRESAANRTTKAT